MLTVRTELDALVERLTAHYGVSPILYVTEASYARYIEGVEAYDGLDIWIRSVYRSPQMHAWTFWQYSNRARLKGYDGDERYIDLNVFRGTEREFEEKYPNGQQAYPADSSADIDMSGRRYGGGAVCRRTGAGCGTAETVDHTVAGVAAVLLGTTERVTDKARAAAKPRQRRDLSVGSDPTKGNGRNDREHGHCRAFAAARNIFFIKARPRRHGAWSSPRRRYRGGTRS